ncbi:hypothetical protein JVT61DRAFT_13517 [Boletus reticuloceps]|uniref:Uncharacterized protein n=1 Tax=Boletus reticuloceps TaxID=495285 RepID=A0A8I2YDE0_9AGAM|nr:hypothetical protein JVT61DRAFT_13517 [Boletus reticuloceps]
MVIDAAPSVPLMNAKSTIKTDTREEYGNRVFKMRRTLTDVPDEARLFEENEDHAALVAMLVSTVSQKLIRTDDLDAEDVMTPSMMVSEHVNEMFDY